MRIYNQVVGGRASTCPCCGRMVRVERRVGRWMSGRVYQVVVVVRLVAHLDLARRVICDGSRQRIQGTGRGWTCTASA